MTYYRFIRHNDSDEDLDLRNGTLYLSNGLTFVDGVAIIRKGMSIRGIFGAEDNSLKHYGRSIDDGAPGVGTGNWKRHSAKSHKDNTSNDLIYKKFSLLNQNNFLRISSEKEKEVRKGEYITGSVDDHNEYYLDYLQGELDNSEKNQTPYRVVLRTKKDVRVRSGRDVVKDTVQSINKKEVTKAFNELDKVGFFNPEKTSIERIRELYNGSTKLHDARKLLRSEIHKYVYSDKESFYNKYSDSGYGAIIDPEDYSCGFNSPMIIIDPDAFRVKMATKARKKLKRGYY